MLMTVRYAAAHLAMMPRYFAVGNIASRHVTTDLRWHYHHQASLLPIVNLGCSFHSSSQRGARVCLRRCQCKTFGKKKLTPNSYLVRDSTESLHLDMYGRKSYLH